MSGPAAKAPARATRVHAIDLLRLIASVQMVSGHTIGALLAPEHRAGPIYENWTIARGLTAVAFLFAAGAAFSLVAVDATPERSRRRVLRACGIIVLGYALHFPIGLFGGDAAAVATAWRELFAVDVLACIGVTLLVLELLARLPAFAVSTGVLALGVLFASPFAAEIEPQGVLLPLEGFLSQRGGSLFPLLPFSGFVLAGASIGTLVLRRPCPELRLVAVAISVLSAGAFALCTTSPPPEAYYAWPALSLMRLGAVLALTAVLALATARVSRLPKVLTILAGQSLFLYASHLMVLYAGGIGLARLIGPTLSPLATLAVALVMVLASIAGALVFARVRRPSERAG